MENRSKRLIIGITSEGSVNLLLGQLDYFKSLGYQTFLLAPYSERSANFCKNEGCEHLIINIERRISPLKDIKTLWQIIRIFKMVKPDILNLGTPKVSLLGMIAGAYLGVPKRIYTCRGFRFEHERGVKKNILILMERITTFFAHKVVCISNSVRDLGIFYRIFDENKSIVIKKGSSNGVNLDLFNYDNIAKEDILDLSNSHGLDNSFVFGFIGRIVDRKGINELISVFDDIYQKNKSLKLILVGPFEMEQIKNKNIPQEIESHPGIIYIGRVMQQEVPKYIALLDVFVLPAWWEGFGNVLVQAAAMGIPVISTQGTGTIDAVSDNFNGILVPVKDKLALKEAMITLMVDNKLRMNYGSNGKVWAKHFDRKLIWDEIHNIYQN